MNMKKYRLNIVLLFLIGLMLCIIPSVQAASPGETTTNYLAQIAIPIVFAVGLLVIVIGMGIADLLTVKSLIMIIIIAVIGVVTLQIITSL